MKIEEMPAGREMDALVAEKVMGYDGQHQWIKNEDGEIDIFAYEVGSCNGPKCSICGYGYCHHCYRESPSKTCYDNMPYSTDIAAAWEVEEAIKEKGLELEAAYCVEIRLLTTNWMFDMIHATPKQRCIAALKAMGVTGV